MKHLLADDFSSLYQHSNYTITKQLQLYRYVHFFFFSSRRRHTRCSRDWSSDVCSSDLPWFLGIRGALQPDLRLSGEAKACGDHADDLVGDTFHAQRLAESRCPRAEVEIGRASCRERV